MYKETECQSTLISSRKAKRWH